MHWTTARTRELEAAVDHFRSAPADVGMLDLVLRRPAVGEREVLAEAELTFAEGVAGDTWKDRGSRRTADGSPHPDMQLNVMNARLGRFIAIDPDRMALAGDQLYVDFDISEANAPAGTRLAIGTAVIEVTDQPHTGLHQVQRALRRRRLALRELARRQGTEAAWHQRQGRGRGHGQPRRHRHQALNPQSGDIWYEPLAAGVARFSGRGRWRCGGGPARR